MTGFLAQATAKRKAHETGTETPVETKPEPTPVVVAVEEVAVAVVTNPAPWAFDNCPQCRMRGADVPAGLTEKGGPCNICVAMTDGEKEQGIDRPVYNDYEVTVSDEGVVAWLLKGEVVVEADPIEKEPEVKEVLETESGSDFEEELMEEPEPAPTTTPTPEVEEDIPNPVINAPAPKTVVEEVKAEPEVLTRGTFNPERTGSKGFVISYASVRTKKKASKKIGEPTCLVHIGELVELVGDQLLIIANKSGARATSFLDIDYFVRRDLINRNARAIAELVGNSTLEASNIIEASDAHVICSALERFATAIYGSMK